MMAGTSSEVNSAEHLPCVVSEVSSREHHEINPCGCHTSLSIKYFNWGQEQVICG
jgi:hypothetical protein